MALSKIQGIEGQVTPNLGRRNLVINGAMQVSQRGASFTGHGLVLIMELIDFLIITIQMVLSLLVKKLL